MALKEGLTPYRSVAVDSRHIPLGTPLRIRSSWPDQTPFSRLVVCRDGLEHVVGVLQKSDLLKAARDLYQWRQEMARGRR